MNSLGQFFLCFTLSALSLFCDGRVYSQNVPPSPTKDSEGDAGKVAPPMQAKAAFTELPTTVKIDIGKVKARDVLAYSVLLRNNTNMPYLPGAVVSSCSCAAATVSGSEVAPGDNVVIDVRIAVPNVAGKFRRRVGLVREKDENRLELLLEGVVEMPFSAKSTEFFVSDNDRTVEVLLGSNEGALVEGSVKVNCVTPDIVAKNVSCKGSECKIQLETLSWTETNSSIVVQAESVEGKKLEQLLTLRVRPRRTLELKPRVLRFRRSQAGFECSVFVYGEKDEIDRLKLSDETELGLVFSDSAADLESLSENAEPTKLRLRNVVFSDHGVSAVLNIDEKFCDGEKCFVRIAFRSREYLDRQYLTVFE